MRRRAGLAVLVAGAFALGACGDDGGGSDEDALADDPTLEECQEAVLTVFERFEIPDSVDQSDGIDDDERAELEAAMDDASEGLLDPNDDDHPCGDLLDGMTTEQQEEFLLRVDPELLALIGAMAEAQFDPIEVDEGL